MKQNALVITTTEKTATVAMRQRHACGYNCTECSGCNTDHFKAIVLNPIKAKEGDMVKIETPTSKIYLAALLLYIIPITITIVLLAINRPFETVLSLVAYFGLLRLIKKHLIKYIKGEITEIYYSNRNPNRR